MIFRKSAILITIITCVSLFCPITFATQNSEKISSILNTKIFISSLPDLNGHISGEITFESKSDNCRQSALQANLQYNGQGSFGSSEDPSQYFLIFYKGIKYIFKGKVCLPADGERYGSLSGLIFNPVESGSMRSIDGKQTASGPVSITGTADQEIPNNVKVITFEGNTDDSLVFLLTDKGFSYVSGSGKVYLGNGKRYTFEDNAATLSTATNSGHETITDSKSLYRSTHPTHGNTSGVYVNDFAAYNSPNQAEHHNASPSLMHAAMNGDNAITGSVTITDIDGNVYHTITLGTQTWTVENLRTTKYNDGSAIPLVTDGTAWGNLTTPGYCYYNNTTSSDSIKKFGALYNWYTVNTGKLAPTGWHVPTDAEWDTLEKYLLAHGYNWDGTTTNNKMAKSISAQTDWATSRVAGAVGNNLSRNNTSGFSALPGGFRDLIGRFSSIGHNGFWWSTTAYVAPFAYYRYLYYDSNELSRDYFNMISYGFSVRLLRN